MQSRTTFETFPERAVIDALLAAWDSEIATRRDDPFAKPGTLYEVVVAIDSLTIVNFLLTVEEVLGFKPPVTVVKRGGYKDCDEMINHLVPAIREHYQKHRNIKPLRTPARHAHRI